MEDRKPAGKLIRKPKKYGEPEYEVEGDTDARNLKYYKEKIAEDESELYEDEIEESTRTASERYNEAKEDDPELPRLKARLEHLKELSLKRRNLK
jgi:hypothetical protein